MIATVHEFPSLMSASKRTSCQSSLGFGCCWFCRFPLLPGVVAWKVSLSSCTPNRRCHPLPMSRRVHVWRSRLACWVVQRCPKALSSASCLCTPWNSHGVWKRSPLLPRHMAHDISRPPSAPVAGTRSSAIPHTSVYYVYICVYLIEPSTKCNPTWAIDNDVLSIMVFCLRYLHHHKPLTTHACTKVSNVKTLRI